MKHDILKFLEDIRLSVDIVNQHVARIDSLEKYTSDSKTIDAVERRLANIGEALFQANKRQPDLPVTDKTKIIGLRHILVHEYDLTNDATFGK
jgi:uncharacterized protein with HEPN domain